jgi:hypothetical protein
MDMTEADWLACNDPTPMPSSWQREPFVASAITQRIALCFDNLDNNGWGN